MVDFVKLEVINTPSSIFLENDLLSFNGNFTVETGEVHGKIISDKLCDMIVTIFESGYTLIQGSLHKFKNGGNHNCNSFTFQEMEETLCTFLKIFNLKAENCLIRNIEIGLNIHPVDFDVQDILDYLVCYRGRGFDSEENGRFKFIKRNRYIIKAYDKNHLTPAKYRHPHPVFRFEISFKKMIQLQSLDISNLGDLYQTEWRRGALEMLLKAWDDIVYVDPTIEGVSEEQKYQWLSYETYWKKLDKVKRSREKEMLNKVIQRNSNNLKKKVSKALECTDVTF